MLFSSTHLLDFPSGELRLCIHHNAQAFRALLQEFASTPTAGKSLNYGSGSCANCSIPAYCYRGRRRESRERALERYYLIIRVCAADGWGAVHTTIEQSKPWRVPSSREGVGLTQAWGGEGAIRSRRKWRWLRDMRRDEQLYFSTTRSVFDFFFVRCNKLVFVY